MAHCACWKSPSATRAGSATRRKKGARLLLPWYRSRLLRLHPRRFLRGSSNTCPRTTAIGSPGGAPALDWHQRRPCNVGPPRQPRLRWSLPSFPISPGSASMSAPQPTFKTKRTRRTGDSSTSDHIFFSLFIAHRVHSIPPLLIPSCPGSQSRTHDVRLCAD